MTDSHHEPFQRAAGMQLLGSSQPRALVCSAFILLLLIKLSCAHCSGGESDPLPEWIPAGSVELAVNDEFLFADGVSPQSLKLGELSTGVSYFLHVPIVNMLEEGVEITDVESSCGCLVAAKRAEMIAPNAKSHLLVHIKPQSHAEPYGKVISIGSKQGVTIKLLVTAKFIPPYIVSPQAILIQEDVDEYSFVLEPTKFALSGDVDLNSKTRFTQIISANKEYNTGRVQVTFRINRDALNSVKSTGYLVEEFGVKEKASENEVFAFPLRLDCSSFTVRPTPLRLSMKEGVCEARIMVLGDWSRLRGTGMPEKVEIVVFKGKNSLAEGVANLVASKSRLGIYQLSIQPKSRLPSEGLSISLMLDGKEFCWVDSISLVEE